MVALTSCGNKNASSVIRVGEEEAVVDSTNAETVNPADPELIANRVSSIYEAVATAYPEIRDITPSTDSLDLAYCSSQWQTLVAMVNAKDAEEMGVDHFFDADYWVMGQDFDKPTASNLNLVEQKGNHAVVDLDINNFEVTHVRLELVNERGDWYIDNIIDLDHDLNWKEEMEDYLKAS